MTAKVTAAAENFFATVDFDQSEIYSEFKAIAEKMSGSQRLNVAVYYLSGSISWAGVSEDVPAELWNHHLKSIGESQSGKVPALVVTQLGSASPVGMDRKEAIYTLPDFNDPFSAAGLHSFWSGVNG